MNRRRNDWFPCRWPGCPTRVLVFSSHDGFCREHHIAIERAASDPVRQSIALRKALADLPAKQ